MRAAILRVLAANAGEPMTNREISRALGLPRTHRTYGRALTELRKEGLVIVGQEERGGYPHPVYSLAPVDCL